jgi:serine/threonine protein kinase
MNSSDNVVTELQARPPSQATGAEDPRLVEVLEEYRALLEAGKKPDRQAFLDRYPELADALSECFEGLDFVFTAAPDLRAAPGQPAGAATPGSVPLGDYRIVREVGRGGMGVVYEAEQMLLGRRVALKVLPFAATMDARQLQRFHNEARAAACLHHPHIVPVHAVGCERGVHYYAMQFIEGRSLAEVIADLKKEAAQRPKQGSFAKPTPPGKSIPQAATATPPAGRASTLTSTRAPGYFHAVARLGIQAAQALHHAHEVGVIHRDIKPANLMLDNHGNLWVTDFGLAQIQGDAQLTMTGDLVGTLRYMSPEQALAKRVVVDHRTDVYSLGGTLYELLTLEPVFDGGDRQELLRQIAFEEPKAAQRHNKSIPAEMETILLKALEKNPADRYASAGELADDLERFVKGEPIRARRPSLTRRFMGWCRRHKALVWCVMATALILAGSAGFILYDRANRLAKVAQQVNIALAEARTAVQTGDLKIAQDRAAQAYGQLEPERPNLPALKAETEQLRHEIEARQADQNRFRQFLPLASMAQSWLGTVGNSDGDLLAKQALDIYGVLDADDWAQRLDKSYLTANQRQWVRNMAYFTLVSLADSCVRWQRSNPDPTRLERSLSLLKRAERFHEPTRAFYFVRSEYHRLSGNDAARDDDVRRIKTSPAESALDYYLPGHTAGWDGDFKEEIRSYRAALALQPDHYNSLFFYGMRLATPEMNRYAEAIHLFTAALATSPSSYACYFKRAECYERLGRLEEAEADYRSVIKHERNMNQAKAVFGAEALGTLLLRQRRYSEAEPLLSKCLAVRDKDIPNDWRKFQLQSMLGEALLGLKRYADAEPLLLAGYKGLHARQKGTDLQPRISEALNRVSRLYDTWGNTDKAERWRQELKDAGRNFVQNWLVLSEPLVYSGDGDKALDEQQIPRESLRRPRAGDRVQAGRTSLVWKEYRARDLYIDFEAVYGLHCPYNDPKLTYAVCYIHADSDRTDLALLVGSDDQAKITINGQEVYQKLRIRGLVLDEDEVKPITIRKGVNVLIFKVANVGGAWAGSIHVVRSDGGPASGIGFGLEPE